MSFWIITTLTALIVVLILWRAAVKGAARETEAAAYDLQIYRDQLKEVERDLARGLISEDEAERIRIEVSRRILAADAQASSGEDKTGQPKLSGAVVAAGALLAIAGGGLALYQELGTPGYPDLPIADRLAASNEMRLNRMTQEEAASRLPPPPQPEPAGEEFLNLMERLRQTVANRPNDLQGLSLLARNEAALGNMDAAIDAQTQIIAIRGDKADAADFTYLAELKIGAVSGYVSKEAEEALRKALTLDPSYPFARYYLAQYMMQVDRPDVAFRTLEGLLSEGPEDAPWILPVREQIEEVAWRAGVNFELPTLGEGPGPTAAEIAAAQEMSPEEREAMIRGMVSGLADRLATEGGSPDEWARLIRALGELGERDEANTIWSEAKEVFAENPSALRRLYSAAQDAEIAQ